MSPVSLGRKDVSNGIRCAGSFLTILPARQKEQDRSCHSGARLKLPHRRKRDPEPEQGLKSKGVLVPVQL